LSPIEKGRLIGYFENAMSQRHIAMGRISLQNRSIQTSLVVVDRINSRN